MPEFKQNDEKYRIYYFIGSAYNRWENDIVFGELTLHHDRVTNIRILQSYLNS